MMLNFIAVCYCASNMSASGFRKLKCSLTLQEGKFLVNQRISLSVIVRVSIIGGEGGEEKRHTSSM